MPNGHVRMVGSRLECRHCGDTHIIFTPCEIPVLIATARAYAESHAACVPSDAPALRFRFDSPEDWLERGDTSASSRVIWETLMGRGCTSDGGDVPRDPAEFGRCYRLLLAFPAWRGRLPEVAARHPVWSPYVDGWDVLCALYEQGLTARDFTALRMALQKLWSRAA
jgi:hypothetical protein